MAYAFAAGATLALCVVFGAGYAFKAIDRRSSRDGRSALGFKTVRQGGR